MTHALDCRKRRLVNRARQWEAEARGETGQWARKEASRL